MMRAYVLHEFGDIENLKLEDVPIPDPEPNEVVVRVRATGLNPIDLVVLSGGLGDRIKLPAVAGTDVSGVVEKVGNDIIGLAVGDSVLGMINFPGTDGTLAGHGFGEYAQTPAGQVVKKPDTLSFEIAAGLPAVGLTAKQALEDIGKIKGGQRVLIHGAAGGVGHMALQIAKLHGAYVFATASAVDAAFVKSLGADEVIDYKTQRFEDIAQDLDLVLDVVGGETMHRSLDVLKPEGIMVTTRWRDLPGVEDIAKAKGVYAQAVAVKPNAAQLAEIAQQVADGKLQVHVGKAYAFDELPEALEHLKRGGVQGKIVVTGSAETTTQS